MIFNCDILASVALSEEMMEWGDDVIQEVSVNVHDERPETDTVGKKKNRMISTNTLVLTPQKPAKLSSMLSLKAEKLRSPRIAKSEMKHS